MVPAARVSRVHEVHDRHRDPKQRSGGERERPCTDPAPENDREHRHRYDARQQPEHEGEHQARQHRNDRHSGRRPAHRRGGGERLRLPGRGERAPAKRRDDQQQAQRSGDPGRRYPISASRFGANVKRTLRHPAPTRQPFA